MGTCAICEKDVLVEDLYDCELCGKSVCSDCITNQSMNNEEDKAVCKNCIEREPPDEDDR